MATIYELLNDAGFSSTLDFLRQHPCVGYTELARMLSDQERKLLPIQVITAGGAEARDRKMIDWFVRDSVARIYREEFPDGWPGGSAATQKWNLALAVWKTNLSVSGGLSRHDSMLKNVKETLLAFDPPIGWLPAGPDDAQLIEVVANATTNPHLS